MANDTEIDTEQNESEDDLEIVRYARGPQVFGLGASTLKSKIDAGLIPRPIPLSADGAALGWTRGVIRQHHAKMAQLAAERRAAAALLPKEKRAKPVALVKSKRKRKLHPPGAKQGKRS
jgi:hypothetical protein